MIRKTIAIFATFFLGLAAGNAVAAEGDGQKAILVTGASSGIGRNLAERLAAEGHFVYAGARKQADIDALSAIDNIQGIRLDVTVQDEIDAAVETITKAGRGLYGLVNNAGVLVIAPMIEVDEEDMQFQMDVNVFGPYRVTRAFAPLIIESKGRISTTGSISGILSGAFIGPYSISKHAIEGFTDSLAAEMATLDVHVSVVEPGNYNSRVGGSMKARMEELGRSPEGSRFQEQMQGYVNLPADRSQFKEPDEVSDAFLHALFDDNPKRRYMVVPNERGAEVTIRKAMEELVQLNEGQEYTYDRAALIRILDEALAATAD